MTRRELYQRVAELLSEERDIRALLLRCVARMRMLRDLPTSDPSLADNSLDEILVQDDALAEIYQAINAPALECAYRSAKRDRRKFTEDEIPAVTQLFTPRWVVEFLLHNTLGKLWMQMHPDSRIELPLLIEDPRCGRRDIPTFSRMLECHQPGHTSEIRVLDPACGTMNFGLVAIEMLEVMYREEIDRAGRAGWPAEPSVRTVDEIPHAIARNNLAGIDIDPVALELARATLEIKFRIPMRRTDLDLHLADALFDSHIEHRFAGACDVVVTNPPYLSARNLQREVVARMKRAYPASWRDAGACFLERCVQFCRDGGRVGILAMQSFMFTGSFEKLRRKLHGSAAIEAIAHFGGGLFDIGNPGTLQTAAIVLRREPLAPSRDNQIVIAFRLTDRNDKRKSLAARSNEHRIKQGALVSGRRAAWTYWLEPPLRRLFAKLPTLAEIAPPRQGLATTDNARFVRYWWEIEPTSAGAPALPTPGKWFAYAKSGRFRRWYEAPRHRVDWQHDGAAIKQSIVERYPYLCGKWSWVAKNASYYGRGGVTWSYLTSGQFSARRLEAGAIFDVAGSALFGDDPLTMLGVLNSSPATKLLGAINPTVNFQVGDLAELPVPRCGSDELRYLVCEAIELQRRLDSFDETTTDFVAPIPWEHADEVWLELHGKLASLQQRIEHEVAALYECDLGDDLPSAATALDRAELARRWVSFAMWQILARWKTSVGAGSPCHQHAPFICPHERRFIDQIREQLGARADQIESAVGGIERFVSADLFSWHVRLYQRRPILWEFAGNCRTRLVAHDRADRGVMKMLMRELGAELPDGWDRFIDDGVAINLAALCGWIADSSLRKDLHKVAQELEERRFKWSRTGQCVTQVCAVLNPGPMLGSASAPHRRPRSKAVARGARPARR